MTLHRIKERPDYLAVAATRRRWVTPSFILQYMPPATALETPSKEVSEAENFRSKGQVAPMVGFTVTKKVGNAVVRNRIRRRMKEVARVIVPSHGEQGARYVMIGRHGGLENSFEKMQKDLIWALEKLAKNADLKDQRPSRKKSAGQKRDKKTKKVEKVE
ncbi:ribonuclease P protein component [Temperatibacter marinus]|uniref:Ribonuclease P protein component n=1 Tax=Temperatibacter marinus TaxID=1456591 RepID=A0AA52ELA7_9PROT|nr:ribonuclease P protein component [Temperatibacter marinus]WND04106.1 ribonuclease P protein component [Temperatibacter marinus]